MCLDALSAYAMLEAHMPTALRCSKRMCHMCLLLDIYKLRAYGLWAMIILALVANALRSQSAYALCAKSIQVQMAYALTAGHMAYALRGADSSITRQVVNPDQKICRSLLTFWDVIEQDINATVPLSRWGITKQLFEILLFGLQSSYPQLDLDSED